MPYKVISFTFALILLFQRAATRHNLAYNATSQVSPGLLTSCPTKASTANDGFMTLYPGGTSSCTYVNMYLFHTLDGSPTPGNLTI